MPNTKLLITGANGFVGKHLWRIAARRGYTLHQASQKENQNCFPIGNVAPNPSQTRFLEKIDSVIHLAAKVHVQKAANETLAEFRRVNVQNTENLARQAAHAGVRRFIFISSIKVNGETSLPARPFRPEDNPSPKDNYATSKLEAEQALHQVEKETGLEVVIIRPPLVYGPEVQANFLRLIQLVQNGLPLPFALVRNKRSLLAVDNLVDLILRCLYHRAAAGQTFLVSDGEDLSTPELIRRLAKAMGRPARLLPVPPALLRLGFQMIGKKNEIERLTDSLQVDISHTCKTLGWRPPVGVDEAFEKIGRHVFSANHGSGHE